VDPAAVAELAARYARLVGFDEKLNIQPDILESFEAQEERIFTFHIREGHKWSDAAR
jgi:peptide/nickel transport system substrate-binding protein